MDLDNNEGKNTVDYYFRQIVAAKLIPLKLALLDSSPDPKKMLASGAAHFNSIVDCFNKAEPPLNIVNIPNMGYLEVKKRSKKEIGEGKSIYYIEGVGNFGKEIYDSDNDCFSFVYNGSEIKSEKSRDGRNGLRAMYGLGLLELIATKEGLGWDNYNIMKLRKAMVETNLNLTAKPFWNANMWDWANNQILAHDEKGKGYNFKQALLYSKKVASRETFFKGFMDGIKGKRS